MAVKNKPKYRKIINAAVNVIADKGFYQAQISKIAKQAGVADGTIYLYFENKEELLTSLFEEKMGEFIQKVEDELAGIDDVKEKLLKLVFMHFKWLDEDWSLAAVTQLELRQTNKNIRLKINDTLKGYLTLIDNIIKTGQEQGLFRDYLDVRLARQMIFGTMDETVTNWVINEHRYPLLDLAHPVVDLLINGLRK
ncbi:TetR/AcrR family transcriptional regulator [Tuberibacillus sp. Marseille-P3662]|uniref:TetR/AcrR family transcriptional regulator n=1 Tax=Tuberibacillus sp. Marseille-P3662 TaxID=1965358 RepID=UPI000A1C7FD2|nr:TetR/AcrR family transcriptional regulator [Tuberibacillus sp. Marseille-P3662]